MLSAFRTFLQGTASADGDVRQPGLQMAAVALLLEVASADFVEQPLEREAVVRAAQEAFGLDKEAVAELLRNTERHQHQSVSLYDYTRVLNEQCSMDQKFEILTDLWRVAFADGELDKYEDHLIRRIADLLYLPHRQFIRAKLLAQQQKSP